MAYLKTKPTLVIDFDALLFRACFAVEKRKIKVIHKQSLEEFVFDTRTDFWGRGKKISGCLEQLNKERGKEYTKEDFEVQDITNPGSFKEVSLILKNIVKEYCKTLNTKKWYGYVGGKDNFRETRDYPILYKANRENSLKPFYYEQTKDYLESLGVQRIHGKEVDDQIATDSYEAFRNYQKSSNTSDQLIACVIDKDYLGTDGYFWYENDFEPTLVQGLGELYLTGNNSKPVSGLGRAFKYFQFGFGDPVDGFKANYYSDSKWGPLDTFKRLQHCKTDKDYWQELVKIYQELYPEEKEVLREDGKKILVNWQNMLQCNVDFAHLQRWDYDRIVVPDVLGRLQVA